MRLIDVKTLQLKGFLNNVPPYAILSHTWGDEEVTFQEYLAAMGPNAKRHAHITRKVGFAKIVGACERAQSDGLQYLWCDTNCIDKRSSAELSEAINSMYAWYRDSVVCYAYLADVDAGVRVWVGPGGSVDSVPFEQSRWFTRGWTLQELLAPKKVVFFDRMWKILGDRMDLANIIQKVTRVHIEVLHDRDMVPRYSIAQRMSWAAARQTSRPEDIAYCLLGIFGIHMPLLYGEGQRAFTRLQEEIMKTSDDLSILAWDSLDSHTFPRSGAFAHSPDSFRFCGSIVKDPDIGRSHFSMTNVGISLKVPVIQTLFYGTLAIGLNCALELHSRRLAAGSSRPVAIRKRVQVWIWLRSSNRDAYERVHLPTSKMFFTQSYPHVANRTASTLFVLASLLSANISPVAPMASLALRTRDLYSAGFLVIVGFGEVDDRAGIVKHAYLPGNFSVLGLYTSKSSGQSHLIISYGCFSTIISAIWEENHHPKHWQHATIWDPNMQALCIMPQKIERDFCRKSDNGEHDTASNCSELSFLHEHILLSCRGDEEVDSVPVMPFVSLEKGLYWDLSAQPVVVAEVIFREPGQKISRSELLGLLSA